MATEENRQRNAANGKDAPGHLHGALLNWKNLQEDYRVFLFHRGLARPHQRIRKTDIIRESSYDILIDWMSMGLDPRNSTFFVQSAIPEHAELYLIFAMITPVPWLERNPTYKDQLKELTQKDLYTYGFLGYPVLQAADILMYKANGVPVGEDQVPHVEMTREIARRFNHLYGDVFPVPDVLLTPRSKLLGIDGRKMSKSYGNAIFLTDTRQGNRTEGLPDDHRPPEVPEIRSGEIRMSATSIPFTRSTRTRRPWHGPIGRVGPPKSGAWSAKKSWPKG